jgi:hypothetical protein
MVMVEKSVEVVLAVVVGSGVVEEVDDATMGLCEEDVVDSAALELHAVVAKLSATRRPIAVTANIEFRRDEIPNTRSHPLSSLVRCFPRNTIFRGVDEGLVSGR